MRMFVILAVLLVLAAFPVPADTPADKVLETVADAVRIRQETQRKEDQWARDKAKLEARYRLTKAKISTLEEQKALWEEKVRVLEARVDELQRRIEESERLDAHLEEILEKVLDRLEKAVAEDLPFLPEERAGRLRRLREDLARTELSSAEKLGQVLDALRVECEYGDTVEVYEQRIQVGGRPVFANVFRLGRLSIFWITPDGSRVGEYDRVGRCWVELPRKYARAISKAVEMAEKRRPVELVRLPLGRISP